jgi:hypothetical protein
MSHLPHLLAAAVRLLDSAESFLIKHSIHRVLSRLRLPPPFLPLDLSAPPLPSSSLPSPSLAYAIHFSSNVRLVSSRFIHCTTPAIITPALPSAFHAITSRTRLKFFGGSFVTRLALTMCLSPHPCHLSLPHSSSKLPRYILPRITSALMSLSPEALFHSSEVFSRQNNHTSAAIALASAVCGHHIRAHATLSWLLQEG